MPLTRSGASTDATVQERDNDTGDELERTVVLQSPTANIPVQQSLETQLQNILQQVQILQEELRQSRQVQPRAASADIITTASSVVGHSQASSQQVLPRKLYDLPVFDGSPEDWPMFKETFAMTTEEYQYSDTQNMMRLQKAIKGRARESIECLLIHSRNVSQIMNVLQDRFGKPELLVKSQISKIRSVAPITESRLDQLVTFANKVQNLSAFLQAADCDYHLSNPTLMEELLLKLPVQRRIEWARHAATIVPRPTICHFSAWLQELSTIVDSACMYFSSEPRRNEGRSRFFHAIEPNKENSSHTKCAVCGKAHTVSSCGRFLDMGYGERWRVARRKRLCFNCLKGSHRSSTCGEQHDCRDDRCTKHIHVLLHESSGRDRESQYASQLQQTSKRAERQSLPSTSQYTSQSTSRGAIQQTLPSTSQSTSRNAVQWTLPSTSRQAPSSAAQCELRQTPPSSSQQQFQRQLSSVDSTHQVFTSTIIPRPSQKLLFKILPVLLYANNKEIKTYAFFDEGSALSLMNRNLASRLGLQGESDNLTLQWFGNTTATEPSSRVDVHISGIGRDRRRFLMRGVRTVSNLQLPMQSIRLSDLHYKYQHLPVVQYTDAVPELLIGLDNAHLGIPRRTANDGSKGHVVVLTKLGWTIYGMSGTQNPNTRYHALFAGFKKADEVDELENVVHDYIINENMGVGVVQHAAEAEDVARAQRLLNENTKKIGTRFETCLLWRRDDVELPESRQMAEKRFFALERKFKSDGYLKEAYSAVMERYVEKGYCRKLSEEEAAVKSNRTWYLPHFGVYNPNKPGKLRLVFDAAAESHGVSLNSALLSGPDLSQPLVTVLMKFRQRSIGVCADIVEMFHQVRIRNEDLSSQRFLWRANSEKPIEEYVMNVMTFGATCSPCSAQFVKNKNAEEFRDNFPEAASAIINNHYVDDFVCSFANEDEALKVTTQVISIHKNGGFELSRFVSNSCRFKSLNKDTTVPHTLNMDRDNAELYQKVLGMFWDTEGDVLKFVLSFGKVNRDVLEETRKPTKREVLSIAMSVFDPFGAAAEYTLEAKLILQAIWRERINWDESISNEVYAKWRKWLRTLRDLENISIPRCYAHTFISAAIELHVFADASESAYATVAYWRITDDFGNIQRAFIAGKTKCAPIKLVSIPRLELQSAVIATRLRQSIIASHDRSPNRVVMWSDSKTVLSWIKSDHRRYKPYVAHRVNEVLDGSSIDDWRWLPSAMNPADFGTRMKNEKRESFWINGPKFLGEQESTWPQQGTFAETQIELRNKFTLLLIRNDISFFNKFSSFTRLKRVVGWILRFRDNCLTVKTKRVNNSLNVSELRRAEAVILRATQMEAFPEEYSALRYGEQLKKGSSLYMLSPVMDEVGVLRLGGRIDSAVAVSTDTRRPVILPKRSHVTSMIINHYHCWWKHQNESTIIIEIRRRYWIPNIRAEVRRACKTCPVCVKERTVPVQPLMGQLPADRLTPFVRPFTYVGLDYMGPFNIVIGRRNEKRWIALFTCLTTRAVHLEMAKDLSTDTCLMCIRNFMCRRGTPVRIRSDNGTNFVGADRELKRQLNEFNNGTIANALANDGIEWIFNCPLNPHAGGCWERLVRSVKRAMGHAIHNDNLQEHALYSLMCEAENIVNSRPLTYVPLDTSASDPLTPNHFLLGTPNTEQTPHPREEKFQVTRKQWRKVQQMQSRFWRKWLDEYLPDLTRRTKWYQPVKPLALGDIVLVCEKSVHQSKWPMGRVIKIYPGKDNQVRAAEIQTKAGIFKRPACVLAKLDIGESG